MITIKGGTRQRPEKKIGIVRVRCTARNDLFHVEEQTRLEAELHLNNKYRSRRKN